MRTRLRILGVSALLLSSFSRTALAGEVVEEVREEFEKMQGEVQAQLTRAKEKVSLLQNQRQKIVDESKNLAKSELAAIEAFRHYSLIVSARYVDGSGDYQPGFEIASKDQESINKLFERYLHSAPLRGRTSAGEALRSLDWGVKRLQEVAKVHSEPSDNNNSELEIMARQIKEFESAAHKVSEVASALGVKSEKPQPESSERRPASTKGY